MRVQSLGQKDPLEKDMATLSSIHAWKILWTEEPGRLQSRGVAKILTLLRTYIHTHEYQSKIVKTLTKLVNGPIRLEDKNVTFRESFQQNKNIFFSWIKLFAAC